MRIINQQEESHLHIPFAKDNLATELVEQEHVDCIQDLNQELGVVNSVQENAQQRLEDICFGENLCSVIVLANVTDHHDSLEDYIVFRDAVE